VLAHLSELVRFRELLWNLVVRDLKVRYKNSVLGVLWSWLNPLFMMVV
jgi:ABC-type polysaccharide/polyol phosphate export permease